MIQYLNENPDFLENYVLNHVNQERLQRWTAWKEQVRRQRHGDNVNGRLVGRFNPCRYILTIDLLKSKKKSKLFAADKSYDGKGLTGNTLLSTTII